MSYGITIQVNNGLAGHGGWIMRVTLALRLICLSALLFASTTPVSAQQKSSPTPQKSAPVAQQLTAQDQFWAELEKLDWKFGPTLGDIAGTASIVVPTGSAFLGSAGTRRFLQLQGNLGADNQFTFAPRDVGWFSVFTFNSSGYVKGDETINPDELLDI